MKKYKPNEYDIAWASTMVRVLDDKAILAMPTAMLIYRIEKEPKKLILTNPKQTKNDEISYEVHLRTKEVFAAIGYTVEEEWVH